MVDYHSIRSVHLEISTRCNAACPMCPRNIAGYDMDLGYPIHDMRLEETEQIFQPDFLKQLDRILINGNFGDFVTARDNLKIVEYFSQTNPNIKIEISTNASAKPNMWTALGKIPNVTVGFAIDGLEDLHSRYRRNTDWNLVISNAKKFIEAGGRAKWRMVKFDYNQHQIEQCRQLSKELGFSEFDLVYDGRDHGPVYNRQGQFEYKIGSHAYFDIVSYPAEAVTWKQWADYGADPKNRIKDLMTIPIKTTVDCHSTKFKEIYVTATGEVYPCCWLGMYPKVPYKSAWQENNFQIAQLIDGNNNALEVGIESAINWFNNIEKSWQIENYQSGRLYKCDQICGRN